jgi:thiamine pyrophosphate-dependent acetolactate synthase large subunit-like protein
VERLDDGIATSIEPRPDYARVAEACGALGLTVSNPGEVEAALRTGLHEIEQGRSVVVNVILGHI